jgi:mono/diheme cytochrome c family protein
MAPELLLASVVLFSAPGQGEALYRSRCAICHGAGGRGDGPAARDLEPRPRDFTAGKYKLRSTASGERPRRDDLFRTITRGIPGTAMPPWSGLSEADRWQLADHLLSMATDLDPEEPPPVDIPPVRTATAVSAERGRQLYQTVGCAECHGPEGRGDGPAAKTLVDSEGERIYPFDLTRGDKLKSGSSLQDVLRVLYTGLDGTPMPSYADSISGDDAWSLALYVRSLFAAVAP